MNTIFSDISLKICIRKMLWINTSARENLIKLSPKKLKPHIRFRVEHKWHIYHHKKELSKNTQNSNFYFKMKLGPRLFFLVQAMSWPGIQLVMLEPYFLLIFHSFIRNALPSIFDLNVYMFTYERFRKPKINQT